MSQTVDMLENIFDYIINFTMVSDLCKILY